ncbi:MAG TPA: response regulator [Aliidongia sp.]|uniref:response regulator n=1 Tax=Aliidongia sp. TaxID=1914230 RepID=UPI002DDD873C|nr:response regulator [Aliidongia sp.]HEV2676252.1 response regulator [Aliidongia sp.]
MSGFTVLIVDDSRSVRTILKNALSAMLRGVQIVEAGDGETAVKLYKQHLADLVFMDITMPGLNGIGALSAIKAFDPGAHVVMLTAESSLDTVVKAKELKADGFIAKPFEAGRIAQLVSDRMAVQPRPIHVLLADDARSIRSIVRRSLVSLPHVFRIREAEDGAQVAELAEARPADLVFLDIHMPNQTGMDALIRIRKRSPETHIVMLTSDASAAAVSGAKALGANDYILKPFTSDQLAAIVDRFVASRG